MTLRPTNGIGYLRMTKDAVLWRMPGRATSRAVVYLAAHVDLGAAPFLESPVVWDCGNSTGVLTFPSSTVSISGSGVSDFNGDQWQLYHFRNGATVAFATSASAGAGGQTLSISTQNFSWVSGDAIGVGWFSTNGGSVPTYVRYSGAFITYKVFAYGLEPGQSYTVRVGIRSETFAGGNQTVLFREENFTATENSHTLILQYGVPTINFVTTMRAYPVTATIR